MVTIKRVREAILPDEPDVLTVPAQFGEILVFLGGYEYTDRKVIRFTAPSVEELMEKVKTVG